MRIVPANAVEEGRQGFLTGFLTIAGSDPASEIVQGRRLQDVIQRGLS